MSVPTPLASEKTSVVSYIERRMQRFVPHAIALVEGFSGGYILKTAMLAATCDFPVVCPADACSRFAGMCDTLRGQVSYSIPYLMEMFASGQDGTCTVDLVGREAAVTHCREGLDYMMWVNLALATATLSVVHMNKARIQKWLTKWYVDDYTENEAKPFRGQLRNGLPGVWTNEMWNNENGLPGLRGRQPDREIFNKPAFVPSKPAPIQLFTKTVTADWPGTAAPTIGAAPKMGTAPAPAAWRSTGPPAPKLAAPNTLVPTPEVVTPTPQLVCIGGLSVAGDVKAAGTTTVAAKDKEKAEDFELILDTQ